MRFQINLTFYNSMDLYRYYIYNKSINLNCDLLEYSQEINEVLIYFMFSLIFLKPANENIFLNS
jgi:hypothetical protein